MLKALRILNSVTELQAEKTLAMTKLIAVFQ